MYMPLACFPRRPPHKTWTSLLNFWWALSSSLLARLVRSRHTHVVGRFDVCSCDGCSIVHPSGCCCCCCQSLASFFWRYNARHHSLFLSHRQMAVHPLWTKCLRGGVRMVVLLQQTIYTTRTIIIIIDSVYWSLLSNRRQKEESVCYSANLSATILEDYVNKRLDGASCTTFTDVWCRWWIIFTWSVE